MASIIGKTIKGQTYYYLRELARVGGKPKVVSQRYLGKAADIEAAVNGATAMPDRTRHLAFGDVAATWAMLERLRVAEIVDEVLGPRRGDAPASVGTYIALACLNRVCDPCSKAAFSQLLPATLDEHGHDTQVEQLVARTGNDRDDQSGASGAPALKEEGGQRGLIPDARELAVAARGAGEHELVACADEG